MKKGISLIALIATVVILSILVTTMVVSGVASSDNAKKIAFGSEISFIQESVDAYYSNNNELPIADLIQVDTSMISATSLLEQFSSENIVGNKLSLNVLDYTKLGITSLKYGTRQSSDSTDTYAVSQTTNKVYYVKGVKIGSKTYFTLTEDLKQTISYSIGTASTFVKNGIIFVPSISSWTNQSVSVDVKIPKTYTSIIVNADGNIIAVTDNSDPDYFIYSVYGYYKNFDIVVNYADASGTYSVKYSVDNFDDTPPNIVLDSGNQQINKNTSSGTAYAYFAITSSSDSASGVKVIKYANENIPSQNIEDYFKSNGKIIRNNVVPIDKYVTNITVYIEDNAGNWTSNWVSVSASVYAGLLSTASSYNGSSSSGSTAYQKASVNVITTVNSTISGQNPSYNNPLIPKGFKAINTTDASWSNVSTDWNNGLVIQDSNANEFVWVPVDGTNVTYAKWCTTGLSYNNVNITDDTFPGGLAEVDQITRYGGFYIARYEAMFDYNGGGIRVGSKKSISVSTIDWSTTRNATYSGYLWNFISYPDVKTYSEAMATSQGYDTTKVITSVVTGTEWDTVMKWIQNSGKSVTDSRTWANCSTPLAPANVTGYGSLQISGFSEYWKAKNIYDLGGNTCERTSEKYSTGYVVDRGSVYNGSGNAAFRAYYSTSFLNDQYTFRVALYLK